MREYVIGTLPYKTGGIAGTVYLGYASYYNPSNSECVQHIVKAESLHEAVKIAIKEREVMARKKKSEDTVIGASILKQVHFDQGIDPVISCVNISNLPISDKYNYTQMIAALQKQITRDFQPVWGAHCTLKIENEVKPGTWGLVFADNAEVANAYGYHELTKEGFPISYVLLEVTKAGREENSVTASHEICFTGDTLIPLLDGTTIPIKDLVGKEEFWVYACKENGELRPGRGHSARLTKEKAQLVEVTLDNDKKIKCTPEHRFQLRDGSFCEAQNLQPGASLMPFYRRQEKMGVFKKGAKRYVYDQVFSPALQKWVFTHRMVKPYCSKGHVRHHKDFNRFNNCPDNIQVMTWEDHQKLHSLQIGENSKKTKGRKHNLSPEHRKAFAIRGAAQLRKYNGSEKHKADMQRYYAKPGVKEVRGERLRKYASSEENKLRVTEIVRSPERRAKASKNIIIYNKSEKHREIARALGKAMFEKMYAGEEGIQKRKELGKRTAHKVWHVKRGIKKEGCVLCEQSFNNHKVVSVRFLEEREDVYDFTVDKYHTFALDAGVFVHNCEMLVDPAVQMLAAGPKGMIYAYETADAVQGDTYLIDGVPVSNFVYPAWFESFRKFKSTKFDYLNKCTRPFQIRSGGYMPVFHPRKGWTQIFANKATEKKFKLSEHNRTMMRCADKFKLSQE